MKMCGILTNLMEKNMKNMKNMDMLISYIYKKLINQRWNIIFSIFFYDYVMIK